MVDANEGNPEPEGQGFRRRQPNEQGTNEARPIGGRHRIDRWTFRIEARVEERSPDRWHHGFEMRTTREFRHHPTESVMHLELGGDHRGAHHIATDDRRRGVVTGGLNTEDHGFGHGVASSARIMTRASPPWA